MKDKFKIDIQLRMQHVHKPIVALAKIYQEAYNDLKLAEPYCMQKLEKPEDDEDEKLLQPDDKCDDHEILLELVRGK